MVFIENLFTKKIHLTLKNSIFIKNLKHATSLRYHTYEQENFIAEYLENYTLEQLNKVPEGFNNNLIWNIAHIIVVVQQMLVYNLSGLPMMASPEMVEKYKRGTKPEADVTQEEVDKIWSHVCIRNDQRKRNQI
jgi:hypothetical protein